MNAGQSLVKLGSHKCCLLTTFIDLQCLYNYMLQRQCYYICYFTKYCIDNKLNSSPSRHEKEGLAKKFASV